MPEDSETFLFRPIVGYEAFVLTEATGLYDALYRVSVALTGTSIGLTNLAHILYVEPEMCFKPKEAVISALYGGVFAEPSANVGNVTIMHISSARAIHRAFFLIRTSK